MIQQELFPEFAGTLTPAHSKIGASSMYRWSKCPGSVRLSKDVNSVSSKYAEEGTKAHELAADILLHGTHFSSADPEMLSAVQVYVDFVIKHHDETSKLYVEHRFDLSSLYPGLFGTADAVIYQSSNKNLMVVDYKHGQGLAVEVEKNSQLMYYGLGALLSFGFPCETVELVVVQPRCPHPDGPIRRWKINSVELIDFAADLVAFAKATEGLNAPLVPGDHCHFCPAAGFCPEIHKKAISLAQEEFRTDLSYDPQKLSEVLSWVPALKSWCNTVTEFAYNEANAGRVPPGFKLVEKRATRKWISEESASEFLINAGLSTEAIYEMSLVSPAMAEKLLDAANKKKMAEVVVSVSSGTTLVPDTDKRQPAKTTAEIDFQPVDSST